MKRIYWRPQQKPRLPLAIIAVAALSGLWLVEQNPQTVTQRYEQEKLAAAHRADDAFSAIRSARLLRGYEIDPVLDPTGSGIIGLPKSAVTSVPGNLTAKQTSVNPDFAAVIVEMLKDAGVQKGDYVAVGCSGSFPALNICTFAAMETLGVRPVVIASASASQFGANLPDLLWIDMERELARRKIFSFRSVAASLGGLEDRALSATEEGERLLRTALARNELKVIETSSLDDGIEERMRQYEVALPDGKYAAYINIGGGAASTGRSAGKKLYQPGLNVVAPVGATEIDSVMTRFAKQDVPILHLVEIKDVAEAYGLPIAPHQLGTIGSSHIYSYQQPNKFYVLAVLVAVALAMRLVIFTDLSARFGRLWGSEEKYPLAEPMV